MIINNEVTIYAHCVLPLQDEIDTNEVLSLWAEVDEFFKNNSFQISQTESIDIRVDSSAIREKIELTKPENHETLLEEIVTTPESSPFGANLTLSFPPLDIGHPVQQENFITRFMEQLFLAMNLSTRGGCNFGALSFPGERGQYEMRHGLHCHDIEGAWHRSTEDGWPQISYIDFKKVWKWLEHNDAFDFVLAKTPIQKALAGLIRFSYRDGEDASDIILTSMILESFLLDRNEPKARGLKRKISAILGDMPSNYKCWIKDFYTLRSNIVHGDYPVYRPRAMEHEARFEDSSDHYWRNETLFQNAITVVVALLQDLIRNNSHSYEFSETINVDRKQ